MVQSIFSGNCFPLTTCDGGMATARYVAMAIRGISLQTISGNLQDVHVFLFLLEKKRCCHGSTFPPTQGVCGASASLCRNKQYLTSQTPWQQRIQKFACCDFSLLHKRRSLASSHVETEGDTPERNLLAGEPLKVQGTTRFHNGTRAFNALVFAQ